MENYALSLANYFIELSQKGDRVIRPLKLMKLVYIAHGYILAMLDRPTDGAKLEKVQAWQYGPVFPSVYYSFKSYGSNPITEKTKVFDFSRIDQCSTAEFTPIITSKEERAICEHVWKNYGIYTDSSLVNILHEPDTPWSKTYEQGKNNIIPDSLTKSYYKEFINKMLKRQ